MAPCEDAKLLVSTAIDEREDEEHAQVIPHGALWSRRTAVFAMVALGFLLVVALNQYKGGVTISHASLRTALVNADSEDTSTEDSPFSDPPCLCVFDIDRTLTGKQGWADQCPNNLEKADMEDQAYAKGTLLLSGLGQGVTSTFCGQCRTGIVTAGLASGDNSDERTVILESIGGTKHTYNDWWQNIAFNKDAEVTSSLVLQAVDGSKQNAVRSMVNWWKSKHSIAFEDENVWFFDDIEANVAAFKGTGFNARQVSCASPRGPAEPVTPGSWDGKIGGCGGVLDEVKREKGVHVCS